MKYITNEILIDDTGKKNAGFKARNDALNIFTANGFQPLDLQWQPLPNRSALNLLKLQAAAKKEFQAQFKKLKCGDTVVIQYPNVRWLFSIGTLVQKLTKRGVHVSILIHDIPSLRSELENTSGSILCKLLHRMEQQCFIYADTIISHNEKMTEYLVERGIPKQKIINLEIFDYLIDHTPVIPVEKHPSVIVAGNLAPEKAGYLTKMPEDIYLNLFGVGFDGKENEHIKYYGSFLPDDLIDALVGNFGLVWDGASSETCSGAFGEYMRFNNPHKISLYLACGIPVIIWKQAALAKFIEQNHCGILVNSLNELPEIFNQLTEEEYTKLKQNAMKIGEDLRHGKYMTHAIKQIGGKK